MLEAAARQPGVSGEPAQQTSQPEGEAEKAPVSSGGETMSDRHVSADAFRALTARLKGGSAAQPSPVAQEQSDEVPPVQAEPVVSVEEQASQLQAIVQSAQPEAAPPIEAAQERVVEIAVPPELAETVPLAAADNPASADPAASAAETLQIGSPADELPAEAVPPQGPDSSSLAELVAQLGGQPEETAETALAGAENAPLSEDAPPAGTIPIVPQTTDPATAVLPEISLAAAEPAGEETTETSLASLVEQLSAQSPQVEPAAVPITADAAPVAQENPLAHSSEVGGTIAADAATGTEQPADTPVGEGPSEVPATPDFAGQSSLADIVAQVSAGQLGAAPVATEGEVPVSQDAVEPSTGQDLANLPAPAPEAGAAPDPATAVAESATAQPASERSLADLVGQLRSDAPAPEMQMPDLQAPTGDCAPAPVADPAIPPSAPVDIQPIAAEPAPEAVAEASIDPAVVAAGSEPGDDPADVAGNDQSPSSLADVVGQLSGETPQAETVPPAAPEAMQAFAAQDIGATEPAEAAPAPEGDLDEVTSDGAQPETGSPRDDPAGIFVPGHVDPFDGSSVAPGRDAAVDYPATTTADPAPAVGQVPPAEPEPATQGQTSEVEEVAPAPPDDLTFAATGGHGPVETPAHEGVIETQQDSASAASGDAVVETVETDGEYTSPLQAIVASLRQQPLVAPRSTELEQLLARHIAVDVSDDDAPEAGSEFAGSAVEQIPQADGDAGTPAETHSAPAGEAVLAIEVPAAAGPDHSGETPEAEQATMGDGNLSAVMEKLEQEFAGKTEAAAPPEGTNLPDAAAAQGAQTVPAEPAIAASQWRELATDDEAGETARMLLDIMSSPSGGAQPQERALASDSLLALIERVPARLLEPLCERIAIMENPPPLLIVKLIHHPKPDIAGLLLEKCNAINDQDLLPVAESGNAIKQRMIARRRNLSPALCDSLIKHGDGSVFLTIVRNPGAMLSNDAFIKLSEHAKEQVALQAPLATRGDTPATIAFELFWFLPTELRRFVLSRFLTDSATLDKILKITLSIDGSSVAEDAADLKFPDKKHVEALGQQIANGETSAAVSELAKLAGICEQNAQRVISDPDGEPLTVAFKALGASRLTFSSAVESWNSAPDASLRSDRNVAELQTLFESLSFNKARMLLTYWDWAARETGPYARSAA